MISYNKSCKIDSVVFLLMLENSSISIKWRISVSYFEICHIDFNFENFKPFFQKNFIFHNSKWIAVHSKPYYTSEILKNNSINPLWKLNFKNKFSPYKNGHIKFIKERIKWNLHFLKYVQKIKHRKPMLQTVNLYIWCTSWKQCIDII